MWKRTHKSRSPHTEIVWWALFAGLPSPHTFSATTGESHETPLVFRRRRHAWRNRNAGRVCTWRRGTDRAIPFGSGVGNGQSNPPVTCFAPRHRLQADGSAGTVDTRACSPRSLVVLRQAAFRRRHDRVCKLPSPGTCVFRADSSVDRYSPTEGRRKAPSCINQAWTVYPNFFWDGRAKSLEEQALGPMAKPIEMGYTHEAILRGLQDNGYAPYSSRRSGQRRSQRRGWRKRSRTTSEQD